MDTELEELERQMEFDRERRVLEEKARQAEQRNDWEQAAAFWKQSGELAERGGDDFSRWYVEGQLANVLIKGNRIGEATELLVASVSAGNDLPYAHRLLVELCMQAGRCADAFKIQRDSWLSVSARAERNGMPPIDPSPQIISFAKWWKDTGSPDPISYAEKWAEEAGARHAWFAVRHERAAMLEKKDDVGPALELYLDLIKQGTKHEATYTRAMLLLERAKRIDEALALARTILGLGLSASLEEQARKRIIKLEAKAAKQASPRTKQSVKTPKAQVQSFSIRTGDALNWRGQVDVTGGFSSIVTTENGVLATGGTKPALWWIDNGSNEPVHLRAVEKRTRVYRGTAAVLITDQGTVNDGSARIDAVGPDWTMTATLTLPGVTSEVAVAKWGLAVGCRAGGLYSVGWDGVLRWRFEVPLTSNDAPFGHSCPYYVSTAPRTDAVVFSSYGSVYALTEEGRLAWKWDVPAPAPHRINALVSFQMSSASVSSVQATRDGGAWVGTQTGEIFRLNGQGKTAWAGESGVHPAQFIIDDQDRLVAIAHTSGAAFVDKDGSLRNVVASNRSPTVVRSHDGTLFLVVEGKVLQVLDALGRIRAVVEFSRSIADAVLMGPRLVIAAGKLVSFGVAL